jgi:DNA-binding response OmpR family regulator
MYSILICEESLAYNYASIFPTFDVTMAYKNDDIINLTYENNYDLYIINFYFYNTIKELKDFEDITKTIFIDEYYNIFNLKKSFEIADDYIVKPLLLEELQIRVNYHYKKLYQNESNIIRYKNFFYHSSSKQLYLKNNKVKVSPNEIKIIELLLTNLNKPVSKDIIYETLDSVSDGSLRVHISKLKKLGLNIDYNRTMLSYSLH